MTRRRVLDFSNYTGGTPNVPALVSAGWDGVILGTQSPQATRQQHATCQAGGLHVDALYVFVYWDGDDTRRLNDAITLAEEFGLEVWLDCEWHKTGYPGSGPAPAPAQLVGLIRQYKAMLGAYYAGIYTGGWWWPGYTGGSTEFKDDPLWHAAYQPTEPNFDTFRPYGGWPRPTIWQYSSNGDQGVNADLNIEETADVPVPVTLAGIGVHYRDGSQAEVWNVNATDKAIDGVGARYSDGTIERLWP